jgi:membrane protein implicated in regulation of membrane protease activity
MRDGFVAPSAGRVAALTLLAWLAMLGVLMLVPATAGTIGLYLSLISLVPTVIWLALLAWRFFQLASPQQHNTAAHTGT